MKASGKTVKEDDEVAEELIGEHVVGWEVNWLASMELGKDVVVQLIHRDASLRMRA